MSQDARAPLVQIMDCRMFGTKPLSVQKLVYLILMDIFQWHLKLNTKFFIHAHRFKNIVCETLYMLFRHEYVKQESAKSWWRHQMKLFRRVTGLLCREFTDHWWFPSQRPVTRSFDVFFDLRLNQQFSKQWRRLWSETSLRLSWRHCNVTRLFSWITMTYTHVTLEPNACLFSFH